MSTSRTRRAAIGAPGLAKQVEELRQLVIRQQEEVTAQRTLVARQQEELAAQRERAEQQDAEIASLRAERAEGAPPAPASPLILPAQFRGRRSAADDAAPGRASNRHTSRRGLLKLGGAAAAAGVAAGLSTQAAHATPTAPTQPLPSGDGAVMQMGVGFVNYSHTGVFIGFDAGGTANQGLYVDATTGSGSSVGVSALALQGGIGVWGTSNAGWGVAGNAPSGLDLVARGSGRILSWPQPSAGPPTGCTFFKGEFIRDANGDMWICVQDGCPGTWRQVAALAPGFTGGAINLLAVAARLLDTRGGAPVAYHATAQFQAAGVGGIPTGATAVLGHLAAGPRPGVSCGDGSSAILWPVGQTRPGAVNIVYNNPVDPVGQCLTGTLALVAIGAGGKISLYSQPILPGVGIDYLFDCFGFVM